VLRYAAELEDNITSPLQQDPYAMLWWELVRRLTPSREGNASASWATVSGHSFWGNSGTSPQTTSCTASGPAGYLPPLNIPDHRSLADHGDSHWARNMAWRHSSSIPWWSCVAFRSLGQWVMVTWHLFPVMRVRPSAI
jgi:hypothetical protein